MVVMLIMIEMSICIVGAAYDILKIKWVMLEQEWEWQTYV